MPNSEQLFDILFATHKPSVVLISEGRSGGIKTSGIEVYTGSADSIEICPINSLGSPSRACRLTIAKDKDALRELARILNKEADML